MAYKQKGCTPITAKIQKTTKGGMTNPLLKAMGVPMKKNPSMAKKNIYSTTLASGDKPTNSNDGNRNKSGNEQKRKKERDADNTPPVTKVTKNKTKTGKAVSYDAAYANADKSKYKTKEEFITAAKAYNKKKYNTTNPTADAKKAGKTKAQLAADVKNNISKSKSKAEKASNIETRGTTEKISEIKTAPKTKKEVRVENRTNRKTTRKENRANRKATREENKANRKAARNASPAKQTMQQQNLKKGNKRVKQKMGKAVVLPVKEKPTNTSKAPAGYSSRTRKDMAAKKAVTPNKVRKTKRSSRAASASTEQKGITSSRNKKSYFDRESRRARQEAR